MSADPTNRSPRQFQCRDYLWDAFEQMSQEYDVSVDYLVNEAMRLYARSRDRGGPYAEQPEPPEQRGMQGGYRSPMQGGMPPMQQPMQQPMQPPMQGGMPPMQGRPGMPPMQPPMQGGMPPMQGRPGMPPMQGGPQGRPGMPPMQGGMPPMQPNRMPTPGMPPMQQPPPNRMPSMQGGMPPMQGRPGMPMGPGPSQPPRPMQAPPMAPPPQQRPGPGPGRTLVALFEGQQYPVTKEEFIIGRGQKTSDLTIRDSNVSRRHAAVVLYNGQYWIVDQQSTNGIEFNGGKVERKVIEDGDLVRICDHEIQFVYR